MRGNRVLSDKGSPPLRFSSINAMMPSAAYVTRFRLEFAPGASVVSPLGDPGLGLQQVEPGTLNVCQWSTVIKIIRAANPATPDAQGATEILPGSKPGKGQRIASSGRPLLPARTARRGRHRSTFRLSISPLLRMTRPTATEEPPRRPRSTHVPRSSEGEVSAWPFRHAPFDPTQISPPIPTVRRRWLRQGTSVGGSGDCASART